MLTDEQREELKKADRANVFVFFAIFLSLGIYIYIAFQFRPEVETQPDISLIRNILMAVSFLLFAIIFPLRTFIMKARDAEFLKETTKDHVFIAIRKYRAAMIVSLALAEAIGLYGFVLFFLGGTQSDLVSFMAGAACTMMLFRPTETSLNYYALGILGVSDRVLGKP